MFLDILCTFLVTKLLLENLSENRLLLPLAKKCCFSRISCAKIRYMMASQYLQNMFYGFLEDFR